MSMQTVQSELFQHFVYVYAIGFGALILYKFIRDKNYLVKHLSVLQLCFAAFFLVSYLFGVLMVTSANDEMESIAVADTRSFPALQEKMSARCGQAWRNEATNKGENGLKELSPCVTWMAADQKQQRSHEDMRSALPSSFITLLIGFLSVFQGSLCASFFYAWVTTNPSKVDTRD